jgi:hypothetical protein
MSEDLPPPWARSIEEAWSRLERIARVGGVPSDRELSLLKLALVLGAGTGLAMVLESGTQKLARELEAFGVGALKDVLTNIPKH